MRVFYDTSKSVYILKSTFSVIFTFIAFHAIQAFHISILLHETMKITPKIFLSKYNVTWIHTTVTSSRHSHPISLPIDLRNSHHIKHSTWTVKCESNWYCIVALSWQKPFRRTCWAFCIFSQLVHISKCRNKFIRQPNRIRMKTEWNQQILDNHCQCTLWWMVWACEWERKTKSKTRSQCAISHCS